VATKQREKVSKYMSVLGKDFTRLNQPGAYFFKQIFRNCSFDYSDFNGAIFSACRFFNCSFHKTNLQETVFSGYLHDVTMREATLNRADFRGVKKASNLCFQGASMREIKLNLEIKALTSEYLVYKALQEGGSDMDERVAWSLFIARDDRYCREFFEGNISPAHIRDWGVKTLLASVEDHQLCEDSKTLLSLNAK